MNVTHETGNSDTKWLLWRGYFEAHDRFVIRHLANMVHILPKRDMDADLQQRVRYVLAANLKSPGGRRPIP
jgi:hypothetical protein